MISEVNIFFEISFTFCKNITFWWQITFWVHITFWTQITFWTWITFWTRITFWAKITFLQMIGEDDDDEENMTVLRSASWASSRLKTLRFTGLQGVVHKSMWSENSTFHHSVKLKVIVVICDATLKLTLT